MCEPLALENAPSYDLKHTLSGHPKFHQRPQSLAHP